MTFNDVADSGVRFLRTSFRKQVRLLVLRAGEVAGARRPLLIRWGLLGGTLHISTGGEIRRLGASRRKCNRASPVFALDRVFCTPVRPRLTPSLLE